MSLTDNRRSAIKFGQSTKDLKARPGPNVSRPIKTALNPSVLPKPVVSLRGILKRPQMKHIFIEKSRPRKSATLEHQVDWYNDIEDELENNGATLYLDAVNGLSDIHTQLTNQVSDFQQKQKTQEQDLSKRISAIFKPLYLSTTTTTERNLKTNTRDITTTAISESLRTFKAKLESHETELTQAWEEFNEVQAKLVMLGREVLGDEMVTGVPEDIENMVREMYRSNEDEQSFKRMMELWDLEAETRVGKLREEVEKIEPEMVKRMTRVEKQLADAQKKEQDVLLVAIEST